MAAGADAPAGAAGACMPPVSRAICDPSHPPPSAFTSPTDDTIRCPERVASFCRALNAVVCAVSTFR
ncbi:outer membrane efflux lipo domain protein [Burkholderia pseudomallei]|nr:outer membrane efflux lipo domain protein [Burkholderia pseudomallei]